MGLITEHSASWFATNNPTLKYREVARETDTFKVKQGDDVTAYNDLPYIGTTGSFYSTYPFDLETPIVIETGGGGGGTVTNVSELTIGTSGIDLSSTVANSTTTPIITLNVPTASATNRGALSATDWNTFNGKQSALGYTPEDLSNKQSDLTASSTKYPTVNAVNTGLSAKQDTLVSATNIKTVNSTSLLGSGNVSVEPTVTAGTTSQYYRGDKTFQTLDKTAVGLGSVDNTSDANKPVSTAQATAIALKVTANTAITGATKTKITYDSKGLVTSGSDATTADISDSTNKRYVTDANLTVIGNTSGTNTGDQSFTASGDATAPSSSSNLALTLATVNSNVGTFGGATKTLTATVGAKGLVTAISETTIAIAESQVTNLTTDLASKKSVSTGNNYKFETTDASGNLQETSVTTSRAVVTDSNGLPSASATTSTELGYVSGVTSAIQTQLNAKGSGTVTSVSVTTANGISGTVANATTTPSISLTLGVIAPTSVNGITLSGSGSVSNSGTTALTAFTGSGNTSGTNTGDQTITLTGDVTGSGNGSFATIIKNNVALGGSPTTTTQSANDNSTKIATTAYVDTAILTALSTLSSKTDVQYCSSSALPANTYNNGSSGVGATLTGNANGPLIADGVTILVGQVGQRILVASEASSANNGWYTITQVGVVAVSPYILTRDTLSDTGAEIGAGYLTSVVASNSFTSGSNNGKVYISIAPDPFTVGTSALTFSQVGGTYNAGNGITLSGSTFSIDTSITVDKTTAQTLTNKTFVAPVLGVASATSITLTSFINEAQGANIASATTTNIGAGTGNYIVITGTTTITAFDTVQAGTRRVVKFSGALTLTYNATSLILPGGVNITTVAGDVAQFISLGSGNWICIAYEPFTVTGTGSEVKATAPTLANPTLAKNTTSLSALQYTPISASLMTTPTAGANEVDANGIMYYVPNALERGVIGAFSFFRNTSSYTLTSTTAAQQLFNVTPNGAFGLTANRTYKFKCYFSLASLSSTSGGFGFALGGTATMNATWTANAIKTGSLSTGGGSLFSAQITSLSKTNIAQSNTATFGIATIEGIITVTGSGTVIPQVILAVATTAVVQVDSYFELTCIGLNTVTNVGNGS